MMKTCIITAKSVIRLSPLKEVLPILLSKGMTSFTLQADRINEVGEIVSNVEIQNV